MRHRRPLVLALLALPWLGGPAASAAPPAPQAAGEVIRLAESPSVSPDGAEVAFAWRGDLWLAPTVGGAARRLTAHPANDRRPRFAPDGRRLAFTSNRSGSDQVYVLDLDGGEPRVVTRHTEGSALEGWFPDGKSLLVLGRRDHASDRAERLFRVPVEPGGPERLLFDDYAREGAVSPDGRLLAFVREGVAWTRKGYRGSGAGQVWTYDLETRAFRRVSQGSHEERWPTWSPDGRSLTLVSEEDGTRNLVSVALDHGSRACLTSLVGDGVLFPSASADGRVVVFRRLFDLWRFEPAAGRPPERIGLTAPGEPTVERERREELAKASDVAFSADGREVAFTAGGDVWVMDTELREPRRVTDTPEEEREPAFSPDFQTLVFVSDAGGRTDLWKAERADPERWWWQNASFRRTRLTDDAIPESAPRFTPDGATLVYARDPGDVWKRPLLGGEAVRVVSGFEEPDFDLSPDGRWLAYVQPDDDFNQDVWIVPLDLSRPPFNVSLHPDDEGNPRWSPDGRLLAFTGRRWDQESDIVYVWLRAEDDEKDARDRRLEKAVEKMKGRKPKKGDPAKPSPGGAGGAPGEKPAAPAPPPEPPPPGEPVPDAPKAAEGEKKAGRDDKDKKEEKKDEKPVEVKIEFEGLTDRLRRIENANAAETDLTWSPDAKRLGFRSTVKGQAGFYTVEVPEDLAPKLLTATAIQQPRWLKDGDQVVGLVDGVPHAVAAAGGKVSPYPFRARRLLDVGAFQRAVFERAWAVMRDAWYDPHLNHRDWEAVRTKYVEAAAATRTPAELEQVANLMLGELNGSHLGFGALGGGWTPPGWRETTGATGARLAPPDGKPGRLVKDVVRDTPAHQTASRIRPGERLLAVDGHALDDATDVDALLTGDPDREVDLEVLDREGTTRHVRLRPTTFAAVRGALYEEELAASRARVEAASAGSLGYLHVRGMNWSSFQRFEEELYKVGHGKDGLVIDVRGNGGGFTCDHLLTCLTQPRHATTVARAGGPGYPGDRLVYAAWSKPIVLLIDQESFSNAEIFAHAVRTLGRGRLVGVTTAGGVISTGGTVLLGAATLRLPRRGWFLPDGRDMERLGCPPDVEVWPLPGEIPAGVDRQLERAVEVLKEDVAAAKARPLAPRRYAAERDGPPPDEATPR